MTLARDIIKMMFMFPLRAPWKGGTPRDFKKIILNKETPSNNNNNV